MSEIFSNSLNPSQKDAVETLEGPLLLLAGAGSGKTRVLTYRTANLIAQGLATPEQILAVTFTNKAAREMEARILSLLQKLGIPVAERLWVSTFHSICARILRDQLYLLDYKPGWGIYDSSDQLSLIKKILNSLGYKDRDFPAKGVQGRINNAKMLGLEPRQVEKEPHFIMDAKSLEIYNIYEEEMKRANSLDFGDLLMKTHILFKDYPDILEMYQNRFQYLMVDEYQDTNRIQYLLVKLLAQKHKNLCVVGDEDQSIYSWRGADISNILDFESDFPGAKMIKLEQNYRSTKTIVSAATAVIANNTQRKVKTLFTENDLGEKITAKEEASEYDEARYIVREIQRQVHEGEFSYPEIAIFYRTNAQSRVIEELLRSEAIPYKLVGGIKFYERKEIKDVLAYLKLTVNQNDDVAFKRVINVPARGIGKTTVEKLEAFASENKLSLFQAVPLAIENKIVHTGALKKISGFMSLLHSLVAKVEVQAPTELYQDLLEASGYIQRLQAEETSEADARIDNLEEFYNAISQFERERGEEGTLVKFLEEMALVQDADGLDENAPSVTLMTLHISKGLEYPMVFITGMEDGLFPSGQSINSEDELAIEEERRLAYVGMTRAEKKLYLTYARKRRVWGSEQMNTPSRFISEIPEEYIENKMAFKRPRFAERFNSSSSDDFSQDGHSYDNSFQDPFPDYENTMDDEFDTPAGYAKGMQVKHPTYGPGSIFKVEGSGDMQKVSVLFKDQTIKKFVAKFARLERL